MSNPNMESKVKELMELKRMKEELEAEITSMEDEIKAVMGEEETLLAGAFKVSWKTFTSSRLDSTALKKGSPRNRVPVHQADHCPPLFHQLKRPNTYHSIRSSTHP